MFCTGETGRPYQVITENKEAVQQRMKLVSIVHGHQFIFSIAIYVESALPKSKE